MAKSKFSQLKGDEKQWTIEDAARALTRAEEIKRDPALLKAAQNHIESEIKAQEEALKKITGIDP